MISPWFGPHVVWGLLLDAYSSGDWERALLMAKLLLRWLDSGGFPPEVTDGRPMDQEWNREVIRFACRFTVEKAKRCGI